MINDLKYKKVHYNPFRAGRVEKAICATLSQREMWSTLILEPSASICYNEVICMEVTGSVSEMRLDKAFQLILKRHEALRASFSRDGKFFVIHEYQYQKLECVNIQEEELNSYKKLEVEVPFDLVNGPLTRAKLLKVSDNKCYILFSAHHIICDGWSLAIILTELTRAYENLELGPVSSFVDFALKENSQGINAKDKEYWLNIFTKPFLGNQLPLDFVRPMYRSFESDRIDLEVSTDLVVRLKKFSAKNRISFYTLLMGGFSILLNKLSKQNDIVLGMATAAQSISGNEEVVGHLVNMLPIRSSFQDEESLQDYLQKLKKHMMDGIEHQCYTFGNLIQDLNYPRNPREIPIINVVFNIDQQLPSQGLEFTQLQASYQSVPRLKENFEIFINAVNKDKELTLECQFNINLFKPETIRNWLKSYVGLLELMINSASAIKDLSLPDLYIPQALSEIAPVKVVPVKRDEDLELKLTDIWSDLLKKEISISDNFFSKGGHSLLVVEMIQRFEKDLKKKISVREVFENPTIIELSSVISEHLIQSADKITVIDKQEYYSVSPAQLQTWYLEEVFQSTPMHNLPASIELKFDVAPGILEETINILINRHESLRSTIKVVDGLPVSVIHDGESRFNLPVVNVELVDVQNVLNDLASKVIDKDSLFLFHSKLLKINSKHFVFFFMPHHMIWDGWSFDIFFEELNTVYSSLINKIKVCFNSPIVLTYKDYASWLNKELAEGHLDNERNYWIKKLKLPLPILNLTKKDRPALMSHEGRTLAFRLDNELTEKLRAYSLNHGVSLYNLFLTAFKMTLSKVAHQDDVIVGTPVRCRNFPELLNVIGYFVNTIALRTQIDPKSSFADNLKKVISTSIEAFDQSQLPYQEVMKIVKYPRDPSRTPIYQTFFSYQDVSNRKPLLAGHSYQQINIEKNSTHTDLDLWIKASASNVEGAFEFRADLLDLGWVESFYTSFVNVLKEALSSDGVKISDFHSMSSGTENVISLFEKNVQIYSNKIAIKSEDSKLTYFELNTKANIYANALIEQGIGSGDFVGIALSRHIELLPALLGILKSGAAYVPLDPAFPQDRLDYMIENSQIRSLITEKNHSLRFKYLKQILIEDIGQKNSSFHNPNVLIKPSSSAYVIYTSGSTGKPKGVEISHLGLSNFLLSMAESPGIKSTDTLLAVTTLSFDIAGLELFLPLISGASIYLANQFDVIDGEALKNIILKNNINYMQATPSTWRLLLSAGWSGDSTFKVLCGGEAFPKDLAFKLIPMVESVWNMYGPTETTIWSTCKQLKLSDKVITVGLPIANTSIYILNEKGELLPQGEEGELYIGGQGVAKGYYNRNDLTAERFIEHSDVGERIYATGDLARVDEYGELIVLGRLDGQVKVRGYRIELGEIEAQLNMMPGIDVSAAITKEVSPGDARIIAFVLTKDNSLKCEEIMRVYLSESLPKYMIPSHFVFIAKMPQTLNGKIDKKTLGEMFHTENVEAPTIVLKHTSKIEEMRSIWEKVLVVKELKDDDNFFDIGGNSLLAVDLSNRVAKHFGVSFQLRLLLEKPNFLDFAECFIQKFLNNKNDFLNTKYIVPIRKEGHLSPLFCIHAVGGNVLSYAQLLPAIENRPVFGVQSAGLVDNDHPGTINGLASLYIKEIKSVQPKGPYYLAGGSMGGMIAFEIAQQLKMNGDEVGRLILLDTFGPDFDVSEFEDESANRLDNFFTMFKYYLGQVINKFRQLIFKLIGAEYTLNMKLIDLEARNYQALWSYRPQAYNGDIYIIRNKIDTGWYADPELGWKKTINGEVHVSYIKAGHSEFIESPDLLDVLKKML